MGEINVSLELSIELSVDSERSGERTLGTDCSTSSKVPLKGRLLGLPTCFPSTTQRIPT